MTTITYTTDYESKSTGCRHYHVNGDEATYLTHYVINTATSPLEYGKVTFNVISPVGVEIYRETIPTRMGWSSEVHNKFHDVILKHFESNKKFVKWDNTFDPNSKIISGVYQEDGEPRRVAVTWVESDDTVSFTAFAHGRLVISDTMPMNTSDYLQAILDRVEGVLSSPVVSSFDIPNVHTMAIIDEYQIEEKEEVEPSNRDIIELLHKINANLEQLVKNTTKVHSIQFGGSNLKIG